MVGQTALALVLLIGSGLLIRSFWELRQVDPGYDTQDVFTFQIAPVDEALVDALTYARFHADFADRIAAMPGVESVGLVENVPLNEGLSVAAFLTEDAPGDDAEGTRLSYTWTAGDYFDTMGIELLRGRAFTRSEDVTASGNLVISETAANALWPGEDPLGRQIKQAGSDSWGTVVGVVEDVMQYGFRDDPTGLIYLPFVGQSENAPAMRSPAYVVKTSRTASIGDEIRAAVREVAPTAPMYRVYTMEGLAAASMVSLSFTMLTLGLASSLALILGAIGLFGVQPADLATFVGMSATMVLVGLLATYLPARRASSVDPIESLRNE